MLVSAASTSTRSKRVKAAQSFARPALVWPLVILLLLATLSASGQRNPITGNLLSNPGAEAGSTANWIAGGDGTPVVDTGTFDPGINPHTGTYDFNGHSGADDTLTQTVSIVAQGVTAGDIDSGTVFASLSFWEQGLNQGTPSDSGEVTLIFLDADGNTLGTQSSGEIDSHDSTWQNFATSYALPVGTRSITYTMNFIRHQGSDNDAYIDDNKLFLSTDTGLTLTSNDLTFANQTVGTPSVAQVVTVTNQQDMTINIADIELDAGANPADFIQSNNCPAAFVPAATCQITISFKPLGVGPRAAGLLIYDDTMPDPQGIDVTGTGLGGILQVNPGSLKIIAGNGTAGTTGNGGLATAAEINQPDGIAFDPTGNLYIADTIANVIRKIDTSGNISTFAGTGTFGYSGDGGLATAALLGQPFSVLSDSKGNIFIQDTGNDVIRRVDVATGIITTYAGTPGVEGHAGDGGPASAAKFNENQGARFDTAGNMFVPQCGGPSVRKIDTAGNISTVAGNFTAGYSGDGGPATSAQLTCPSGVAIDAAGNFYIADEFNQVIRKVDTSGTITTFAGTGLTQGFTGDGGPATAATLNYPNDVALDAVGNLYIADSENNAVRKVDTKGIITTVAGSFTNAGSAAVNTAEAVTLDSAGNLYFSALGNSEIDEYFPQGVQPFPATTVGTPSATKTLTLSNIGNVNITIPGTTGTTSSFTLTGNTTDFAIAGGTCIAGITLTPTGDGSTCTLQLTFTPTVAGTRTLTVGIADDALNSPQSFTIGGAGSPAAPTLAWPTPASIVYGTPLSAAQLDAVASGFGGVAVAGTYAYTPALGSTPAAGSQPLTVTFTSTDPSYSTATATVPLIVTQATPTITWPTPASIAYGVPLSAAQLDATAVGIATAALPGTFTYTPAVGAVLRPGTQPLSVAFTPTDAVDYLPTTGTTNLLVSGLTLASIAPAAVPLGAADTTVTFTGAGFVASSQVRVNGAAVASTYVSDTMLTAIIPAADLTAVATLQVSVNDPSIAATSAALPFNVIPASPVVTFTGPSTTPPGSQPAVNLTLTNPYPLDITATFTLSFAAASDATLDDPAIQFSSGGRTFTTTVPANSTVVPAVDLQSGTLAGTITITVTLAADSLNVTPPGLAPILIAVPAVVPYISSSTMTASGSTITVVVNGYSNTRDVATARFHFTAPTGAVVSTPDVVIPAATLFGTWFDSTPSTTTYGSTFTYTQIFNVSEDASTVGTITVTLTNSVGDSAAVTSTAPASAAVLSH